MISYTPLFHTLNKKKLVISNLREFGVHPTTIASINKGESIKLEKIDSICNILNVPINEVVEIILENKKDLDN